MPVIIPANSDGNREITVDVGAGTYRFRTYYSQGEMDGWYLDISDVDGNQLMTGLRITAGAPNILKGQGDMFRGVQVAVVVTSGKETDTNSIGSGTFLVWFNAGEKNPYIVGDPLLDIDPAEWDFGEPGV